MKITILRIKKPKKEIDPELKLNEELQWLCKSFGLFGERDKEKSCYRVFLELLRNNQGLTSDEIAVKTHITRGTVIHHINILMDRGLAISQKNRYKLRTRNLSKLIKEIEEDVEETFKEMEKIAKRIDKSLR
ncbi:MAG: winged helix-turn-helix transcriptional regulator [Nanoarchaeota archaeon]|nr:winged helix-turn-helix transcriptional regulator [Nanoarchaeota archaeon]